jgi:DNA-binding CsgD family transcriptional regulator
MTSPGACQERSHVGLEHLHQLEITRAHLADNVAVPSIIAPLVDAAARCGDLVGAVTTITRSMGFDTFTYGMSTVFRRPEQDSIVYSFTTAPQAWVRLYHESAHIEIDPRIEAAVNSTLPYIWDQASERGKGARVDQFLDDAARYGLCSGVSFLLPDSNGASVIACLNSSRRILDEPSRALLVQNFGAMFTFGYYFHELFMRSVVAAGKPSAIQGAPLTARERECLTLAANGLTTEDVAERLGIKPRTAQFHFDSIRTKLAVETRHEAIARAVQRGLIALNP